LVNGGGSLFIKIVKVCGRILFFSKYPRGKKGNISTFWSGFLHFSLHINLDIKRTVGNGKTISFWHDIWVGSTTLANYFPHLYAKTRKMDVLLATVWNGDRLKFFLRQGLTNIVRVEKLHLLSILNHLDLDLLSSDSAIWHKHSSGLYSVNNAYEYLNF
jgi:hypothetical protein